MTDNLVVMLTAFNLEYEAVQQRLVDSRTHRHERGTRFELGTLQGTECRVALGLTGKGNHPAAVLAERAMQQFSPVAVLFVGVAGALWDATPLGDVVMATHVYAYHGGTSEDDGLKARPRAWEVEHGISQLASHLGRTGDWATGISGGDRAPRAHFGGIAAGELVQNSRISYEARWVRQHYNDALAIEMEAAGVAQAGHLNGSPVAIVRGISDRADGTKTTDVDGFWQPRAATNAAAFATRLAEELVKERENVMMNEDNNAKSGAVVHNHASGPVGIQGANVTGNTVSMSAEPQASTTTDLATELAAFREQVKQQYSTGKLDQVTYQETEAELDIASKALDEDTQADKSKFVLALKRVRGLVGDVAELATKVATLIAAANGLA